MKLGLRVMWTDPPVDVGWFGWSDTGRVHIFENAIFRQGTEEFRYTFDTIRLGPIPDSTFEPGPDN